MKFDLNVLIIFSISMILFSCNKSTGCPEREVMQIKSPDGRLNATVMQKDCGLNKPVIDNIYVLPVGKSVEKKFLVLSAGKIKGLEVTWTNEKLLNITYSSAKIFHFTNFIDNNMSEIPTDDVLIIEKMK